MMIKKTKDLSLFTGYDLVLAKCHMSNWGVVYYYADTLEPLEVEEVIEIL